MLVAYFPILSNIFPRILFNGILNILGFNIFTDMLKKTLGNIKISENSINICSRQSTLLPISSYYTMNFVIAFHSWNYFTRF